MKKLDIILGSDGVLADTQPAVLALYNTEYKDKLTVQDITSWELGNFTKPGSDIGKFFRMPGFFRNLKYIEGSREIVSLLVSEGHNVYIATSSPTEGYSDKKLWLVEGYPNISPKNIAMLDCKYLLEADVILDDGLHNLNPTRCKFPIVFDQPWNRTGAEGLIRAYDWFDFYNGIIQKIKMGYTYQELLEERNMLF